MKVYKISGVTLSVENMEKSCKFYSRIPGFKIAYGGSNADSFTTFEIGEDITSANIRQIPMNHLRLKKV